MIHDKAVLGFQVEYKQTFDIGDYILTKHPDMDIAQSDEVAKEKKVAAIQYLEEVNDKLRIK
jgi:hypothetical protein